ncbi:hypothetical protein BDV38DRAFT_280861 [Aspergillus pseudotamarii]|uniref:Uncharacterized protein n=1 Tax=Aspergillus pseudotamarii TaxID=132259 RepID=A0A5N6SZX9_ASPPS|nr:uncharacterized protein BDV38DRAFT_280861 [Aspergillus pseudotamarii]KAE8139507.1 hypothetical protein BDV38DRAFT_280861 [Aspergillus pseudotamarii]
MKVLYFLAFLLSYLVLVSSLPVEGDEDLPTAAEKDNAFAPGETKKKLHLLQTRTAGVVTIIALLESAVLNSNNDRFCCSYDRSEGYFEWL